MKALYTVFKEGLGHALFEQPCVHGELQNVLRSELLHALQLPDGPLTKQVGNARNFHVDWPEPETS